MNNFTYMKDKDFSDGRDYMGASDMPTIAGINEYQSPYEFWEVRTGRKKALTGILLVLKAILKRLVSWAKNLLTTG